MVLSITTAKEPLGTQKIVMCSVGTVGMVLAIATSSSADTLSPTGHMSAHFKAPKNQWEYTQAEQTTDIPEEAEAAADRAGLERLRARLLSPKTTTETSLPPAHGIYLYGQQPVANQPETAYFVFESQGTNVTGALYMPSSSFDCVHGQIIDQRMALRVTDSYSQETYSYALTLNEPFAEVASQGSFIAPPLNIDRFYPLPVREQDRAILATCQAI